MIPKIIHHIAPSIRTTWHPVWEKCYESWLKEYSQPEYNHMLWNDTWDLDNLVKFHLPRHYHTFKNIKRHIVKIDFCKAVMVYVYGGMYVDMDFFCFQNFYNDLNKEVILSQSPHSDTEIIQNGIYGSVKRHPFTKSYIDDMIKNIHEIRDSGDDEYVLETVGPGALSKSYLNHGGKYRKEIQVLPHSNYNPHPNIIKEHTTNPSTIDNIKCAHLMTGIWGNDYLSDPSDALQSWTEWRGIDLETL